MASPSEPPFDAYRANACATLQLLCAGEQWREQWLALAQRRFARDRAALHGTLDAIREAQDWRDFAAGSEAVWRDYLSASAALWQDGVAAALHATLAWNDSAREALQQWQQSIGRLQSGPAAGAALPMREWMAAFERAASAGAAAAAGAADAAASAGSPARARTRRERSADANR